LYISDGDDDVHEISFVGSSNLSRTINAIRSAVPPSSLMIKLTTRSAPIVLDNDEPESGPSSYEDEEPMARLPDIMDLLRSDPPEIEISPMKRSVKVKVDKKGKGKAGQEVVEVDVVKRKRTRPRSRSRSPDTLIEMGNSYIIEGTSTSTFTPTASKKAEGNKSRKKARSPRPVVESEFDGIDDVSSYTPKAADPTQVDDSSAGVFKADKEAAKADEKKRKQLEKDKAKVCPDIRPNANGDRQTRRPRNRSNVN